ncbi:hypothetical protein M1589_02615 [Candidatus Marsarchaeota archaeon]|jgi:thymidylate kinase|nr:hypothetical protein [Candidatus Marsarchaeota archaeon]
MGKLATSNSNKLIVLEGLPGSGKTSHLEYLSKFYSTISEISSKMPKNPNDEFFLNNDIKKYRLASKKELTIMDRNYVSSLAFSFSKLLDLDFTFFHVLRWYLCKRRAGLLWQPYFYIYIKTPVPCSIARKKRKKPHRIWSNPSKLMMMEIFYSFYFSIIESEVKIIDGRRSHLFQRKEILRFLKQLN